MGAVFSMSDDERKKAEPFDISKIYWDGDGNLRHGTTERNRDQEILELLQSDTSDQSDNNQVWVIMPSRWIRLWLQFAYVKLGDPPGPGKLFSGTIFSLAHLQKPSLGH